MIINHIGDMLVRPSFIETSLLQSPCGELPGLLAVMQQSSCSPTYPSSISAGFKRHPASPDKAQVIFCCLLSK